jgi:hypothetical protein
MRYWHARLAAALAPALLALGALCLPSARAEDVDESQLLYRQALQSISEGRKNDASETLMRVIEQEPLHAGAWLDLALIQCSLGHAEEAERLFAAIQERFHPPPGIQELIADTRAAGCSSWRPFSQYSVSVARGIDQNVNQGASVNSYSSTNGSGVPLDVPLTDDFKPKHDQYTLVVADYLRDLSANGTSGFLQFQSRRYDRLGHYNSSSLFFGVDTPWRFGSWTLHGSANMGLITLGTQLYQRQSQLQARLGPPLPLPGSMQFNLSASLTRAEYLTLSNFNGNTAELRGQFSYRSEDDSASASLSYLDDHALSTRPGGDRSGWLASTQWRHQFGSLAGELGYTRQDWHGSSDYSPGFINTVREQTTHQLRAALTWTLNRNQSLQLEARQVHNRENISIFQYNDRQLQLSWQWQGM